MSFVANAPTQIDIQSERAMSTFVEAVVQDLMERDGVAAIWKIHLAAAQAHRLGHDRAAEMLLGLADAAEELCQRHLRRIRQERKDRRKAA
jgi:hypothetical protein